jgi:hypothetical protein
MKLNHLVGRFSLLSLMFSLMLGCEMESLGPAPLLDRTNIDKDNDGYPAKEDCDDQNAEVHELAVFFPDTDADGHGAPVSSSFCALSYQGYVKSSDDCDDANASIWTPRQYFLDADLDGFGSANSNLFCTLSPPSSYSLFSGDPNDGNALIVPSDQDGDRVSDLNDCNPTNPNEYQRVSYFSDSDGDGLGDPAIAQSSFCVASPAPQKTGYALLGGDSCPTVGNERKDFDADGIDDACDADWSLSTWKVNSAVSLSRKKNALNQDISYRFGGIQVVANGRLTISIPIVVSGYIEVGLEEWTDLTNYRAGVTRPQLILDKTAVLSGDATLGLSFLYVYSGEIKTLLASSTARPILKDFYSVRVQGETFRNPTTGVYEEFLPTMNLSYARISKMGAFDVAADPFASLSLQNAIFENCVDFPLRVYNALDRGELQDTQLGAQISAFAREVSFQNNAYNALRLRLELNRNSMGTYLSIEGAGASTGAPPTTELFIELLKLNSQGGVVSFRSFKSIKPITTLGPVNWRIQFADTKYDDNVAPNLIFTDVSEVRDISIYLSNAVMSVVNSNLRGTPISIITNGQRLLYPLSLVRSEISYPTGSRVYQIYNGQSRALYGILHESPNFQNSQLRFIASSNFVVPSALKSLVYVKEGSTLDSISCGTPSPGEVWTLAAGGACVDGSVTGDLEKLISPSVAGSIVDTNWGQVPN